MKIIKFGLKKKVQRTGRAKEFFIKLGEFTNLLKFTDNFIGLRRKMLLL